MEKSDSVVVCDLEAGIGTSLRLRADEVDVVIVVAEPTVKSLEVAERVAKVAQKRGAAIIVAANRITSPDDVEIIRTRLNPQQLVEIPEDPSITQADRNGQAPIDLDDASPAIRAIGHLAESVMTGQTSAA